MNGLPQEGTALLWLALLMGLRHGVDADHVAAIDGLTRANTAARRAFAPYCGALFSAGHGAVVVLIASAVVLAGGRWQTPGWLASLGAAASFVCLVAIGVFNLHAVLSARGADPVVPTGLRARAFRRLFTASSPAAAALVGAVFAASFDTVSQVALFALTGVQSGGWQHAVGLAGVFVVGMFVADTGCGLWIGRLLMRADALATVASRVMGLAVALLSLAVAGLVAATWLSPTIGRLAPSGWVAGMSVLALTGLAYLLAWALARRTRWASLM